MTIQCLTPVHMPCILANLSSFKTLAESCRSRGNHFPPPHPPRTRESITSGETLLTPKCGSWRQCWLKSQSWRAWEQSVSVSRRGSGERLVDNYTWYHRLPEQRVVVAVRFGGMTEVFEPPGACGVGTTPKTGEAPLRVIYALPQWEPVRRTILLLLRPASNDLSPTLGSLDPTIRGSVVASSS